MIKFKRFYIPPGWKCENDAWQYSYDSQGNLIQESDPKRNLQYIYDTQNRQTHILSGKTVIQENRYDGEGLRAGLNVQGKESTFLFTNGNLALELDEFNQPVKRYIRGYGAAALEHHGIYHGIHRDEQLSTGWITGVSGEIENACEYDAFGNLLGNHEEVSNCILYGGQQYDAETEQYYLRARYYNPVIGRFIQEDPYRGDGLNLYAYCGNNPVVYYDSSGNVCGHTDEVVENTQNENVKEKDKGLTPETAHIYRQMCEDEATATINQTRLQYAIEGAEPTKWITQSKEKAFQFKNILNENVKTVVVDFEITQKYMDYLQKNSVKQRGSKKNPNNKFHYEGLPKPGPYKNFGILENNIEEFNKNLISTTIINQNLGQEN